MPFKMTLLATVVSFIGMGPLSAASISSASIEFSIEAQSLINALTQWAKQSRLKVTWQLESSTVTLLPVSKVTGSFTPAEALSRLLDGTGLTFNFVNEGLVIIQSIAHASAAPGVSSKPRDREPIAVTPSASVENVIVTGTHIRGIPPVGSPIEVFEAEHIRRRGYGTTDLFLKSLPQSIRTGAHGESADSRLSAGAAASGNISFGSGVDLRGLGSTATLILVNGHRIAPSGQGFMTDVSLIPPEAIERVEVLLDGASAVYGADAVAGVINFILKQDVDEANTSVRYGLTLPTGREEARTSQAVGAQWDGGSLFTVASYLSQSHLSVDERPFTRNVDQPGSIFPRNRQISVLVSGHHELAENINLRADLQYGEASRRALGAGNPGYTVLPADVERINAFTGFYFEDLEKWEIALKGHISQEDTGFRFLSYAPGATTYTADQSETQHLQQRQWALGIAATGVLSNKVDGGNIKVALGAERREEQYTRQLLSPVFASRGAARSVDSAYLELNVPVFGGNNASLQQQLSLSLAGRYDDYSDFGSIANPKFGVSWTPASGIEIRSTYSRSFRAPATGTELSQSARGTNPVVPIYSFTLANESVPVALLTGSRALRPEKAEHWTVGFSIRPKTIDGLTIGATYYDIAYYDRIAAPPLNPNAFSDPALQSFIQHYDSADQLQEALEQQIPTGVMFTDRTGDRFEGGAFGPSPQQLATALFDARLANVSVVHTSGIDISVNYSRQVNKAQCSVELNANYTGEIKTVYAPRAPAIDVVGTTGNPTGMKMQGIAALAWGPWDTALTASFTRGYTDTLPAVHQSVGSYITVDANVRYSFPTTGRHDYFSDLSIMLIVTNVFNRAPPHISGSLATRGAEYDAANADPLGRFVGIELAKAW